jgi:hypothetical protein
MRQLLKKYQSLFEPRNEPFRSLRGGASWRARKAHPGRRLPLDQFLKIADFRMHHPDQADDRLYHGINLI